MSYESEHYLLGVYHQSVATNVKIATYGGDKSLMRIAVNGVRACVNRWTILDQNKQLAGATYQNEHGATSPGVSSKPVTRSDVRARQDRLLAYCDKAEAEIQASHPEVVQKNFQRIAKGLTWVLALCEDPLFTRVFCYEVDTTTVRALCGPREIKAYAQVGGKLKLLRIMEAIQNSEGKNSHFDKVPRISPDPEFAVEEVRALVGDPNSPDADLVFKYGSILRRRTEHDGPETHVFKMDLQAFVLGLENLLHESAQLPCAPILRDAIAQFREPAASQQNRHSGANLSRFYATPNHASQPQRNGHANHGPHFPNRTHRPEHRHANGGFISDARDAIRLAREYRDNMFKAHGRWGPPQFSQHP